jgi:uncharacterized membrane protein
MPVTEFIAVFAATLFTGASVYINLAEHPARMECGTELAATVFGPSYRRAALMQVLLAVVATLTATAAWMSGGSAAWLVGALLIFAVIPFTFFAIMPTNRALLDPALDRTSEAASVLLRRWGRLHGVRSGLALASSVILLHSMGMR